MELKFNIKNLSPYSVVLFDEVEKDHKDRKIALSEGT
jgi:ATP-dependent Clp protease ATP-binding subunit ClpA